MCGIYISNIISEESLAVNNLKKISYRGPDNLSVEKHEDIMMLLELSWMVYTAPHHDPKKMKKSIDAFWPLNREVSDNRKERMQLALIEAQKNYLEEKKLKDGNSRS